jgi:hypothetical protein
MVMSIPDVSLPGVLPLVVERSHRTGVKAGRWFGAGWTSTLDQRLLADDEGIRFIADDGTVLYYAVPEAAEPAQPIVGPSWPLSWDGTPDGEITVWRPDNGTTLRFRRIPSGGAGKLLLAGIEDRNGNIIDVRYAPDGSPEELIHHSGYRLGIMELSGVPRTASSMTESISRSAQVERQDIRWSE